MNANWITVVGTLTGAIIGAGIAILNARYQIKTQEKREKNKYIVSKLEDIFESISQFRKSYKENSLAWMKTLSSAQSELNLETKTNAPLERLQMLIGFYAPELKPELTKLLECRENYGDVLVDNFGVHKKDEQSRKKYLGALFHEERKISEQCDKIQEGLIFISKKYL
jgi:gas vesicle protein